MCGIFAVHNIQKPAADRSKFIALSKKQRHRGPDWSGCHVGQRTILAHERLAIVGVGKHTFENRSSPLTNGYGVQTPAHNPL